jgi:hypothetical protein
MSLRFCSTTAQSVPLRMYSPRAPEPSRLAPTATLIQTVSSTQIHSCL